MGTYSIGLSRFSWDSLDNMQAENGTVPRKHSPQGMYFSFQGTVAVSAEYLNH